MLETDRAGGLAGEMALNEASSLNNINIWAPVRSEQKDAGGTRWYRNLDRPTKRKQLHIRLLGEKQ